MSDVEDQTSLPMPVAAPAVPPALHSLLATGRDVTEPPETVKDPVTGKSRQIDRWTQGLRFMPESCDQGGVWVPCVDEKDVELNPDGLGPDGESSGSGTQLKSAFDPPAVETYYPFVVEGSWECSTIGFGAVDYEGRAARNLELVTTKQVEQEAWTGRQMAQSPSGAGNMSFVRSTPAEGVLNDWDGSTAASIVPVSARDGLALIQQGLADRAHGTRGMIHAIPYLADLFATGNMTKDEGQLLTARTRGTYIVSGAGYPGTGPIVVGDVDGDGNPVPHVPDANQVWMFGTSPVELRFAKMMLVPGRFDQAIDRRTNLVHFTAEKYTAAVWDPCVGVVAVLVDLTLGTT